MRPIPGLTWTLTVREDPGGTEDDMSDVEKKGSGLSLLDTALITAAVIVGIFVILWIVRAVAGLFLFAFKVAILVVVVAVIVRVVHLFSRRSSS
jgi:hypothetical protein